VGTSPSVAFTALSIRLAELTVSNAGASFGVRASGMPVRYDVGVPGAPRWRIRTDWSPDTGWEIDTIARGEAPGRPDPVPEDAEWAYLLWAEGTRAERGCAALCALPTGRYLLVRSSIEPRPADWVDHGGNDGTRGRPNTLRLLDRRPYFATVIGAADTDPPVLDQPLVGLVVLNYTGNPDAHGANFFAGPAPRADAGGEGDLVLVVPVTGELVVDAAERFSAADSARARRMWRDAGARSFADALIGR
jgi:hypothetical protein